MKQLRLLTRVYDRETNEYIQRALTYDDLTEEQQELIRRFFEIENEKTMKAGHFTLSYHGFGENGEPNDLELESPLGTVIKGYKGNRHNRFRILNDFGVVDSESGEQINGFSDC